MQINKSIITTALILGITTLGTKSVYAAQVNEKLVNNCESTAKERLNSSPNTAPSCYGISRIQGEFSTRNDIDWINHFPIKSGTQNVYVYTSGKTMVNLYRGKKLVHRGYTATRGWVRLSTRVDVNVTGQNILALQLSGNKDVSYTVNFPEVVKN